MIMSLLLPRSTDLWPYDHNELSSSHGLLKPRVISRMKETDCGGMFHVDRSTNNNKNTQGKEFKNKKEVSSSSSVSLSVSTTNAQELTVALIKHFCQIFELHGAKEFSPSTLLQLRESPAVTLSADLLYTRGLLLQTSQRVTSPQFSQIQTQRKKQITLSELWKTNIMTSNSNSNSNININKKIKSNSNINSSISSSSNGNKFAVAEFLEPGAGLIVSLPYDLISAYARTVSLLNIRSSVRYQVGRVYSSRSSNIIENMNDYDLYQVTGGQNPLTPLGVGSGEHPLGANEMVFDIVRSGPNAVKVHIECEMITAAMTCISAVRPSLPVLALRVTDSRLLDALLEICLWPLPHSASSSSSSSSSSTSSSSSSFGLLDKGNIDHIDIERLLRAFSLCTDVHEESLNEDGKLPKYSQLLTDLNLSSLLTKRLVPFFRLLSMQFNFPAGMLHNERDNQFIGSPLLVLDALEKEFYNLDIIVLLQRLLARQNQKSENQKNKKNYDNDDNDDNDNSNSNNNNQDDNNDDDSNNNNNDDDNDIDNDNDNDKNNNNKTNEDDKHENKLHKKQSRVNTSTDSIFIEGKKDEKKADTSPSDIKTILNKIGVKVMNRDRYKEKEREREREKEEKEKEKERGQVNEIGREQGRDDMKVTGKIQIKSSGNDIALERETEDNPNILISAQSKNILFKNSFHSNNLRASLRKSLGQSAQQHITQTQTQTKIQPTQPQTQTQTQTQSRTQKLTQDLFCRDDLIRLVVLYKISIFSKLTISLLLKFFSYFILNSLLLFLSDFLPFFLSTEENW